MHALLTPILLCVVALGASAQSLSDDSSVDDYLDPRFLFVNATGSLIPLNISGLVSGLGFLAVLALFGIGIWLLITAIAPYKFGGYGGGYGNSGYGGGYGGGHSGGSSYSDYQASMYRRALAVAVGVVVQMLSAAPLPVAGDAGLLKTAGAVSRSDLPASSGAYVAEPPVSHSSATYSVYPPYPYPYPYAYYPYPTSSLTSPSSTASDDTSRLFGGVANALNPSSLLTCPSGDTGCVVQKIFAAMFIFAGIGLAVYLVYALVNGTLGNMLNGLGRSADGYSGIFNTMSVLDWIAMGEEVYRKFDTNIECQERLVCELHQNENSWGNTARKMNDAFGYLQYLELLNLPSEVRMVVDNYLDAANKGRTSQTGCDQLYKGCEFSVKNIINKYSSNQI